MYQLLKYLPANKSETGTAILLLPEREAQKFIRRHHWKLRGRAIELEYFHNFN